MAAVGVNIGPNTPFSNDSNIRSFISVGVPPAT